MKYNNKVTLSNIVVGVITLVVVALSLIANIYSIAFASTFVAIWLLSYIGIAKYISFISLRNRKNTQQEKANFLLDDEEVDKEASLVIISIIGYIYFLNINENLVIEKSFYDLSNYLLLSIVVGFELFIYSLLAYFFKFSKQTNKQNPDEPNNQPDLMGYSIDYHCLNLRDDPKTLENRGPIRPILFFIHISKIILAAIAIFALLKIFRAPGVDQIGTIFASAGGSLAILAIVFRDGLKSISAGIRIWMDDLVEIGEKITSSRLGFSGKVIDITLTNIKIKNIDNTISNLPLEKLITSDFKNHSEFKNLGRRISFVVNIDQRTIKKINNNDEHKEILGRLNKIKILERYMNCKASSISEYNDSSGVDANNRSQTNIGVFRAYVYNYLEAHPFISNKKILVKNLSPTTRGLPVTIIAHTNRASVSTLIFRTIESDIIDHVLSNLETFDLRILQSGNEKDIYE